MSRRVSFSPDQNTGNKAGGNKKRVVTRLWTSNLPRSSGFSPVRFLKQVSEEVATALGFVSARKKRSGKVSSASSFRRSCSYAETMDSQRAEAIEDCIEFLNSSSSLQRSNSVGSSC